MLPKVGFYGNIRKELYMSVYWKGKERTLSEIAEMENISFNTFYRRYCEGEPIEICIMPPLTRHEICRKYEYDGQRLNVNQIARKTGITSIHLYYLLRINDYDLNKALNQNKIKAIKEKPKEDYQDIGLDELIERCMKAPSKYAIEDESPKDWLKRNKAYKEK